MIKKCFFGTPESRDACFVIITPTGSTRYMKCITDVPLCAVYCMWRGIIWSLTRARAGHRSKPVLGAYYC